MRSDLRDQRFGIVAPGRHTRTRARLSNRADHAQQQPRNNCGLQVVFQVKLERLLRTPDRGTLQRVRLTRELPKTKKTWIHFISFPGQLPDGLSREKRFTT